VYLRVEDMTTETKPGDGSGAIPAAGEKPAVIACTSEMRRAVRLAPDLIYFL